MAVSLSRSGERFAAGIDADVPNGKLIQLFRMSKVVTRRQWMNFKALSRSAMVIERAASPCEEINRSQKLTRGKSSIYLWLRIEQAHSLSSSYLSTMPFKQFSKWNKQGDRRRSQIEIKWQVDSFIVSFTALIYVDDNVNAFVFDRLL